MVALPSSPTLPLVIWSIPWVAPETEIQVIDLSDLDTDIFGQASGDPPPKLELLGETSQELAKKLCNAISYALDNNDFERILSMEREFVM